MPNLTLIGGVVLLIVIVVLFGLALSTANTAAFLGWFCLHPLAFILIGRGSVMRTDPRPR